MIALERAQWDLVDAAEMMDAAKDGRAEKAWALVTEITALLRLDEVEYLQQGEAYADYLRQQDEDGLTAS